MAAHQVPLSLGFSRQEYWNGLPVPSSMHESKKWKWSHSVVSDPQRPYGLQPSRLLCPWDFQARVLEWGVIAFSSYHTVGHKRVWPQFTEQLWGTAWGEIRWMNYTTTGLKWWNLRLSNGKTFSLFWFWQIGFYSLFEELKISKHNFWTNRTHGGFTDSIFLSFIALYDLHLGN